MPEIGLFGSGGGASCPTSLPHQCSATFARSLTKRLRTSSFLVSKSGAHINWAVEGEAAITAGRWKPEGRVKPNVDCYTQP
jgi:hypothetical protein